MAVAKHRVLLTLNMVMPTALIAIAVAVGSGSVPTLAVEQ